MENATPASQPPKNSYIKVSLNIKYLCIFLAVVIVAMLALWRPWSSSAPDNSRTVKVTGEATIKATPDEFIFYPSYEFKNPDKTVSLADLTKKSDEITKKVKELGVADKNIKTTSSGYEGYTYYYDPSSKVFTYSLQLTITVDKKELAQKVQDYLVTTSPSGNVSPQAGFSDTKQKQLEQQARDEATKEARQKADQSARNLGFKIGKVKSLDDGGFGGGGCGGGFGLCAGTNLSVAEDTTKQSSLSVQPGENKLDYSVTVEYYIH